MASGMNAKLILVEFQKNYATSELLQSLFLLWCLSLFFPTAPETEFILMSEILEQYKWSAHTHTIYFQLWIICDFLKQLY